MNAPPMAITCPIFALFSSISVPPFLKNVVLSVARRPSFCLRPDPLQHCCYGFIIKSFLPVYT
ncbi:hypothetical protein CLOHYLEM_07159 [[Clostridium] hylemonae DSM 15053]|uniref:Uncharacterized protein n=1 Tax=[Clostridium] hylemonae DSM 15053 TaxID=553973 RepID=C0C4Z3_9FIRM|nr:hypothetical protein CLOHYLEM_07159 [[Clostridium] hylemonae DSM 15053]